MMISPDLNAGHRTLPTPRGGHSRKRIYMSLYAVTLAIHHIPNTATESTRVNNANTDQHIQRFAQMIGAILFVFASLFYAIGAFAADFNETHVYNPRWPPHAKFHNGQTMSLAVLLALCSIYLFFRQGSPSSRREKQHDLLMAAVVGSFYCLAGLTAIVYPGTDWVDPGNETQVKGVQIYIFGSQLALNWLGYFLESRKVNALKLQ